MRGELDAVLGIIQENEKKPTDTIYRKCQSQLGFSFIKARNRVQTLVRNNEAHLVDGWKLCTGPDPRRRR